MSKGRTNVYVVCLVLFPLAFAGFVIGFGCPVWLVADNLGNYGLWQYCAVDVFKNCSTLNFDSFMPSQTAGKHFVFA
jgi:nitrate reductase NapE component